MLSAQEVKSLNEQKAMVLKELHKSLMEHRKEELGEEATPEQLEKTRLETLETAKLVAEGSGQQIMGLYNISKQLKDAGYRELRPLVWKVELDTDLKEINNLKEEIGKLLKKQKELTREEVKSRIELAIQPYTADYMRQQMLTWRQERLAAEKENVELKAEIARMKMEKQQKTAAMPLSSTSSSSSSSSRDQHQMDIENESKGPSKTLLSDFEGRKRKANGKEDEEREKKAKTPSPQKSNSAK